MDLKAHKSLGPASIVHRVPKNVLSQKDDMLMRLLRVLQAIQCLGGNGYVNEYPTGRFLRDAKLYEIGAGTSEIRRMIIGRELFKEQ